MPEAAELLEAKPRREPESVRLGPISFTSVLCGVPFLLSFWTPEGGGQGRAGISPGSAALTGNSHLPLKLAGSVQGGPVLEPSLRLPVSPLPCLLFPQLAPRRLSPSSSSALHHAQPQPGSKSIPRSGEKAQGSGSHKSELSQGSVTSQHRGHGAVLGALAM